MQNQILVSLVVSLGLSTSAWCNRAPDTVGKYVDHRTAMAMGGVGNYIQDPKPLPGEKQVSESNGLSFYQVNPQLRFPTGSSELTPGEQANLVSAAKDLAAHPEVQVRIEGYTDSQGGVAMNDSLSERRAETVRNILSQNGVKDSQMIVAAYGEQLPIAPNSSELGRSENRRVELHVFS